MKVQNWIFPLIFIAFNFFTAFSQTALLPSVNLKNLKGEIVDTKDFGNNGKPYLIVFFASCCSPSLNAMNGINEKLEEWQSNFSLKVIAISIDDSRTSRKVAPLAKGKGWAFDIFLDENSILKRAMSVNNKPHYILFNGNGEIILQKTGYIPGIEEEIQNELEKIKK